MYKKILLLAAVVAFSSGSMLASESAKDQWRPVDLLGKNDRGKYCRLYMPVKDAKGGKYESVNNGQVFDLLGRCVQHGICQQHFHLHQAIQR